MHIKKVQSLDIYIGGSFIQIASFKKLYRLITLSLKQGTYFSKSEGLTSWIDGPDFQGDWPPSVSVARDDDLSQASSPGALEHP